MKLVLNTLDKSIVFYLDRNTLNGIMKEFKTMGEPVSKNLDYVDNDLVVYDGLVINSYPNMDDNNIINNEYTYMLDDIVVNTYNTRTNDSLVVKEDRSVRIITGYDDNLYKLDAEYFGVDDKVYSVFPNYKIKADGSIEKIDGSALNNLKRLRTKQCKVKTI